MPFIRLKQPKGEYVWDGRHYDAGKIVEVTDKEAYYLIHQAKVAEAVPLKEKERIESEGEIKRNFEKEQRDKIQICLIRLGGYGDSFLLACHARAVKRKWPNSVLTLYIRDKFEPIADMEAVDRTVVCGNANWSDLLSDVKGKNYYDIILDNRYVTKIYFRNPARFEADERIAERCFKPYKKFYHEWIQSNARLADTKVSAFDLFYKSTGLEGGEEDIEFPLKHEHFKFAQILSDQKYVTIHNGADIARQTKCWPTPHWNELVRMLKDRGYKVVTLGKQFEEKVDGAVDLTGMTTFFETAALIAKARFHIDSESGLVHIARGVGTRSIVLFGPTPVECFGYGDNINLETPIECRGCWWSSDYWWRDCPHGYAAPVPCMAKITPQMVMEKVEEIEEMPPIKRKETKPAYDPDDVNEQFAMDLQLTEGHYRGEKHQWERINIMMDAVKGPKVLEVGAGDGYCSLVLKKRGFDVTSTEVSKIRIERMRKSGLDPVEAPVQKLPFPDAHFDSVVCGEVLEHIPNWWEGMKELERVLKPDGRLILSWPIHPDYDALKMHLWSIRAHTVNRNGKPDLTVQVLRRINRDE